MRKIIHADCDSFYASVEMRDDPSLRDQPVAVGGAPDKRGVVATCNYAARRFGIHSAMPMSAALRRCPSLVIVRTNMAKYQEVSRQVRAIFERFTAIIEPLSLDEAFLDVSDNSDYAGSATRMAEAIRSAVRNEVEITISAGIAPNKFLAKIASDWNKPVGQFTVTPDEVEGFVAKLPVEKLFGVGAVTAQRMHNSGLRLCSDLQGLSLAEITKAYGKFGARLYELCRGIDNREVKPHRVRKSISVERTYAVDLPTLERCLEASKALFTSLEERIDRAQARSRIDQRFVKVRFADFSTTTASAAISGLGAHLDRQAYEELIVSAWQRGRRAVRLLGLGVRLAQPSLDEQMLLFGKSS